MSNKATFREIFLPSSGKVNNVHDYEKIYRSRQKGNSRTCGRR